MTMQTADEAQAAKKLGMDPALVKPAKELFADIGKRVLLLISKIIGVKMVILAVFVWLAVKHPGVVTGWMLVFIALVVIFGREALKFAKDLKG